MLSTSWYIPCLMYLLNKIDKILLIDTKCYVLKKVKIKGRYYILNHNYKQYFQFQLLKQAI